MQPDYIANNEKVLANYREQQLLEEMAEMLLKKMIDQPTETVSIMREFVVDMGGEIDSAMHRRIAVIEDEHAEIMNEFGRFEDKMWRLAEMVDTRQKK